MTAACGKLLICEAAWAQLAPVGTPWQPQRIGAQELPPAIASSVLVATLPQAEALLARSPSSAPVILLWVASGAPIPPLLRDHASVAGVLGPESSADAAYTAIRSACALAVRRNNERAGEMLEHVLDVGRSLASEKNLDTLLDLILTHARELTRADGASIYTLDEGHQLHFRLWQNASLGGAASLQKTPVGEQSIAGFVARSGELVVLDDAYDIPASAPYRFDPTSDRTRGYRTKSLLTVPLKNKADEVVGVLQLVNRKDATDVLLKTAADFHAHVRPFDAQSRAVALALAGQAGVALENSILYASIERLFEGFIRASVQAIEARDPTTAGHSERVADYTERFAIAVDRADGSGLRDLRFSKDELRELRYASLLHDFGKVGVREHVLVKAKKLLPQQLELIKQRFRYARASLERATYRELLALHERRLPPAEHLQAQQAIQARLAEQRDLLARYLDAVLRANEPSVLAEQASAELAAIASFVFPGEDDERLPLLQDFEFADLSLPKGSLNSEERAEIESHVTHTYAFLSLIPWTKNLANLPNIAYAHHEKLDGTGYPRKLPLVEIPVQSRMMTISDIYDALTASDRPYKRAMPAERALDILGSEARAGKIDATLFKVFMDAGAYQIAGA